MTRVRLGGEGKGGRRCAAWPLLLAGVLFAALSGCGTAPALLVVLDPYLAEALNDQGLSRHRLEGAVAEEGRGRVEILQPGDGATEGLRALVRRTAPRGVYLSPLLARAGGSIAAEFPETLFFTDGSLPPGSASPGGNLRSVRYEFPQAHAEAGHALGMLLADPAAAPALRALVEAGRTASVATVATVAVRPDKGEQRELQLFRASLLETGAVEKVEERELTSLEDRARARRILERLREEGTAVFLLHTSTLTGFCLEVLQTVGGLAVVEGLPGVEAYSDVLLLTLERDFPAALRAMSVAAIGGRAGGATAMGTISAPVHLHWWGLSGNPPESSGKERAGNE
jgi:hypothetical protein